MTNCNVFYTVVCAIPMASLEIKAPKKLPGSRVYALRRGYRPNADLLGQWRNSYQDITTKTSCVKHTWSPTSQWYLQASPAGACLHDKLQSWWVYMDAMNACVQWMHELHQQYSSQNSSALPANGFLPKCLFCGVLAAGYLINATLRSVPFIT